MDKYIFKYLYYFSFIFIFFPFFVIYIFPGTNGNIMIALLFLLILYLLIILFKFKRVIRYIKYLSRNTIIRSYLYFLGFVMFTTIINILCGNYKETPVFYIIRVYKILFAVILVYFLPLLIKCFNININLKNLIRLFYCIIWVFFLVAIIQYLSFIFDISIIYKFIDLFSNARVGLYGDTIESNRIGYRAYSFFSEPSGLGQFIFIIMPFVINLSKTKYKLFENKYFNFLIKKTILPMMLLVIILTKSPIYLCLCLIEFFVLILLLNYRLIKKYFLQILCIISLILFIVILTYLSYKTAIEQTYFIRIIRTVYSLGDYNKLVVLEPSLATRIFNYSMQLVIFTKKMFIGCGLSNSEVYVNSFYLKEALLPLTPENYIKQYLMKPNSTGLNKSIVYTSLAEFGIIGFCLYSFLIYKMYYQITNIQDKLRDIFSTFASSISQSIIAICVISFYNLSLDNSIVWLIYGLALAMILVFKQR